MVEAGIQLDRIDPGHPEQNGRHERFHLTLQQETTTPAGGDAAAAATRGSIGCAGNLIRSGRMKRSANSRRRESMWPRPRPYPARLEDPWYDATHQVRRVVVPRR